jgi:hypothetical protein
MKLIKNIIAPDRSRKPDFIYDQDNAPFTWVCSHCAFENTLTFEQASELYWKSEQSFNVEAFKHFKDFYDLGSLHKSMEGWPYFFQIQCPGCNEAFLLFLGIKEPKTYCLVITLQAITEISE